MNLDDFMFNEDDSKIMKDTDAKISALLARMHRPTREGTRWIANNDLM